MAGPYGFINIPKRSIPAVLGTREITNNGTYNAVNVGFDGYSAVKVDVEGSSPLAERLMDVAPGAFQAYDLHNYVLSCPGSFDRTDYPYTAANGFKVQLIDKATKTIVLEHTIGPSQYTSIYVRQLSQDAHVYFIGNTNNISGSPTQFYWMVDADNKTFTEYPVGDFPSASGGFVVFATGNWFVSGRTNGAAFIAVGGTNYTLIPIALERSVRTIRVPDDASGYHYFVVTGSTFVSKNMYIIKCDANDIFISYQKVTLRYTTNLVLAHGTDIYVFPGKSESAYIDVVDATTGTITPGTLGVIGGYTYAASIAGGFLVSNPNQVTGAYKTYTLMYYEYDGTATGFGESNTFRSFQSVNPFFEGTKALCKIQDLSSMAYFYCFDTVTKTMTIVDCGYDNGNNYSTVFEGNEQFIIVWRNYTYNGIYCFDWSTLTSTVISETGYTSTRSFIDGLGDLKLLTSCADLVDTLSGMVIYKYTTKEFQIVTTQYSHESYRINSEDPIWCVSTNETPSRTVLISDHVQYLDLGLPSAVYFKGYTSIDTRYKVLVPYVVSPVANITFLYKNATNEIIDYATLPETVTTQCLTYNVTRSLQVYHKGDSNKYFISDIVWPKLKYTAFGAASSYFRAILMVDDVTETISIPIYDSATPYVEIIEQDYDDNLLMYYDNLDIKTYNLTTGEIVTLPITRTVINECNLRVYDNGTIIAGATTAIYKMHMTDAVQTTLYTYTTLNAQAAAFVGDCVYLNSRKTSGYWVKYDPTTDKAVRIFPAIRTGAFDDECWPCDNIFLLATDRQYTTSPLSVYYYITTSDQVSHKLYSHSTTEYACYTHILSTQQDSVDIIFAGTDVSQTIRAIIHSDGTLTITWADDAQIMKSSNVTKNLDSLTGHIILAFGSQYFDVDTRKYIPLYRYSTRMYITTLNGMVALLDRYTGDILIMSYNFEYYRVSTNVINAPAGTKTACWVLTAYNAPSKLFIGEAEWPE